MKLALITTVMLLLTACLPQQKHANYWTNWSLDTENSQLTFISTKNKRIAETHTIGFANGTISADSHTELIIDLNQVETQIEVRNQRVKDLLFETVDFPNALVTAQLPPNLILNTETQIDFELSLHGFTKQFSAIVVAQQVENKLVVTNFNPVAIHAKDFGLDAGINKLISVAKLKAISYEVPVDFKLVFHKIKQL